MRKATGKWHLLGRVTAGSQPASAITDTVIRGLSTSNNVKCTAADGTAAGKFGKHVIRVVECHRDKYKSTTNDNSAVVPFLCGHGKMGSLFQQHGFI